MYTSRFNQLFKLIFQQLTEYQKQLAADANQKRRFSDYGPLFKNQRTYFSLEGNTDIIALAPPQQIVNQLENAGFYITDYRAGIAMKKAKAGEQKDLRQIKIGKILNRLNKPQLSKQFNQRLKGTTRKDIKNLNLSLCITWNLYDIAGMSTGRNWTSCMDLQNGWFKETPLRQVQYGGMCAYLIDSNDKEIQHPYARIAIKRMVNKNNSNMFIFLSQKIIYGQVKLANEFKMSETLNKILNQSNKQTKKSGIFFNTADIKSYSDQKYEQYVDYQNLKQHGVNNISADEINDILLNNTLTMQQLQQLLLDFKLSQQKQSVQNQVWKFISLTQPLTIDFIAKHLNDVKYKNLFKNNNIDTKTYQYIISLFKNKLSKNEIQSILDYASALYNKDKIYIDFDLIKRYFHLTKVEGQNISTSTWYNVLAIDSVNFKNLETLFDQDCSDDDIQNAMSIILDQVDLKSKLPFQFLVKYLSNINKNDLHNIFNYQTFTDKQFDYLVSQLSQYTCYQTLFHYDDSPKLQNILRQLTEEQILKLLQKAKKRFLISAWPDKYKKILNLIYQENK